jgi:hypothetical protein
MASGTVNAAIAKTVSCAAASCARLWQMHDFFRAYHHDRPLVGGDTVHRRWALYRPHETE